VETHFSERGKLAGEPAIPILLEVPGLDGAVQAKWRLGLSALCSKAFCDLTESSSIAKTRRNKELE
jgi:hypothetical protein